jgi:hypothetical protein
LFGWNDPDPPEVQTPEPVPPRTVPLIAAEALLEQIDWEALAITVGCLVTCTSSELVAAGQAPLFTDLSVKVTEPRFISDCVREYEVVVVLVGEYCPLPLEVHVPLLATPLTVPLSATVCWIEHMSWLRPAVAWGAACMITLVLAWVFAQGV